MTGWTLSEYSRILGEVLREYRKAKQWTRKDMLRRLDSDLSLQTLATYELGTRHVSVDRLDELAAAYGSRAHVILAEVDRRRYPDIGPSELVVNLAKLAKTTRPELAPVARWAAVRRATSGDHAMPIAALSVDALCGLANLCALDLADLFDLLREFDESPTVNANSDK